MAGCVGMRAAGAVSGNGIGSMRAAGLSTAGRGGTTDGAATGSGPKNPGSSAQIWSARLEIGSRLLSWRFQAAALPSISKFITVMISNAERVSRPVSSLKSRATMRRRTSLFKSARIRSRCCWVKRLSALSGACDAFRPAVAMCFHAARAALSWRRSSIGSSESNRCSSLSRSILCRSVRTTWARNLRASSAVIWSRSILPMMTSLSALIMRDTKVCRPQGELQIDDSCGQPMRPAPPLIDVATFAEMGKCLHVACPIAFGQAQAATVGCHTYEAKL